MKTDVFIRERAMTSNVSSEDIQRDCPGLRGSLSRKTRNRFAAENGIIGTESGRAARLKCAKICPAIKVEPRERMICVLKLCVFACGKRAKRRCLRRFLLQQYTTDEKERRKLI